MATVKHVAGEQLGHVPLVVVVDLQRAVDPADRRAHRGLGLDDHQREAVDQQHQVGAPLGWPGAEGVLLGDDVLVVAPGRSKSIRRTVTCSPFSPKGIERSPRSQAVNSSLALDEPVAAHRQHDGAQLVEHLVGAVGLLGDLRVQADEGLADEGLDEDVVVLAGEVSRGEEVPAETAELAVPTGEPGADGGVVGDAAAEEVAEVGLDGVGFGEGHFNLRSPD